MNRIVMIVYMTDDLIRKLLIAEKVLELIQLLKVLSYDPLTLRILGKYKYQMLSILYQGLPQPRSFQKYSRVVLKTL